MKQKLMDAAIMLWHKKSYDTVSITDICEYCEVTKGSFYYYFQSKSEILSDYFQMRSKAYQPEAIAKSMVTDSCIEKIWILLSIFNQAALDLGAELIRMMICTSARELTIDSQTRYNSYISRDIYDLILVSCSHGQETGEIRCDESPEDLIEYLMAEMTGLLLYWGASNEGFDIIAYQRKTLDLLLTAH